MVVAPTLLLLHSRISRYLLVLLVAIAATARLGKPLRLVLASKLLLLQQEVRWRRGKERNSLLESWRKLSSVTEGWGTAEGILRHG